jgi:hypothetical protein
MVAGLTARIKKLPMGAFLDKRLIKLILPLLSEEETERLSCMWIASLNRSVASFLQSDCGRIEFLQAVAKESEHFYGDAHSVIRIEQFREMLAAFRLQLTDDTQAPTYKHQLEINHIYEVLMTMDH